MERDRRNEEERTAKLQKFAGRWVVLEGNEVVAVGDDASAAAAGARARGVKIPYLSSSSPSLKILRRSGCSTW
ncbi:MAG: DUF5678 domain-containing protein [Candidatus Binatia bacterium]